MDISAINTSPDEPAEPAGIYVHIPFCRAKCAYCDFASFAGLEAYQAPYLAALLCEIEGAAPGWVTVGFDTLFVGGGTPTVMPADGLVRLLLACRQCLVLAAAAEVSIEANPGTVSPADLSTLRRAGYNRLSLGVQSLLQEELALLGRVHDVAEALDAYHWARQAGFANVNLDLIYGLPRQSVAKWRESLLRALELTPEHLSLYALSVEEGTPLQARIARGELPAPDDDAAADMYELAEELLERAGYVHYEISNWARRDADAPARSGARQPHAGRASDFPALACRHNLKYWRNLPYLGLGSAAYSYDGRRRWGNVASPQDYIARVGAGRDPVAEEECLNRDQHMDETMMLGLRLVEGVRHADFFRRFGVRLGDVYDAEIAGLVHDGLLEADGRGVRLTPRGRLLGNRAFAAFLRTERG